MPRPAANRSSLPSELAPAQIIAIVDTREQLPLILTPLQVVRGTLKTGDYSVLGEGRDVASLEQPDRVSHLVDCAMLGT